MKARILHAMVLGGVLVCLAAGGEAWAEPKNAIKVSPSHVFNVPTTGKIVDVDYRPEFDEWWVKCKEDKGVAVYCYDRATKQWSKVLFSTAKPQPELKKPEKDVQAEKREVTPDKKKQGPKEAPPVQESPKPGTDRPEPEEAKPPEVAKPPEKAKEDEPQKKENTERKRWWNPLELLKKGEDLIRAPLSPDAGHEGKEPDKRKMDF